MNKKSLVNEIHEINCNLLSNIKIIFLGGIFFGMLFAVFNVVNNSIVNQQFEFVYVVSLDASADYNSFKGISSMTAEECRNVAFSSGMSANMQSFLGSQEAYDEYISRVTFAVSGDMVTITYYDADESNAKEVLRKTYSELGMALVNKGTLVNMDMAGDIGSEKVRQKVVPKYNMGITHAIELGIIFGLFLASLIVTIGYMVRGNIKDEMDVYKYFDVPVLANVPPIVIQEEDTSEQT